MRTCPNLDRPCQSILRIAVVFEMIAFGVDILTSFGYQEELAYIMEEASIMPSVLQVEVRID